MAGEYTTILTSGPVTVDVDDGGVFYVRTQSGDIEVIEGDIAITALARVRQLELTVATLSAAVESLSSG
jgi:hypothetical protein